MKKKIKNYMDLFIRTKDGLIKTYSSKKKLKIIWVYLSEQKTG